MELKNLIQKVLTQGVLIDRYTDLLLPDIEDYLTGRDVVFIHNEQLFIPPAFTTNPAIQAKGFLPIFELVSVSKDRKTLVFELPLGFTKVTLQTHRKNNFQHEYKKTLFTPYLLF